MERTTLVFSPQPRNGRELGQLVEAIAKVIPVKAGKKVDEIEVDTVYVPRVQKILQMNGYSVVDKRIHEASQNKLTGAIKLLGEKYNLFSDDRPTEVKAPPSLHKRHVMNFVNRKAREARKARTKVRAQHKRDHLDGKIAALNDVLRYLRKR